MDAAQIAAMIADREAGTPGPWKVFHTQDGGNVIGIGDAEAGGVTDPQFGLWRSGKERESNARRIARVPDMEATIIAQAAELERLRAERDALPEKLIDILHVLDVEAQTIANRISGMTGAPCRHPDGVHVLEDAETIIRAAFDAMKGGTR